MNVTVAKKKRGKPVCTVNENNPLAALRVQRGESQAQVAKCLGVSLRTVQYWEEDFGKMRDIYWEKYERHDYE